MKKGRKNKKAAAPANAAARVVLPASWFNGVMAEVMGAINAAGSTPHL